MYSGTSASSVTTKARSGISTNTTSFTNLTSGETYYAKVVLMTTDDNFLPATSSTVSLLTNHIDETKTVKSLKSFNAVYNGGNAIPASGTGGYYVIPTNVSASSVTAYTVVNYTGGTVSSDGFEVKLKVTNLSFTGTSANTASGLNTSTGGIKVNSRETVTGSIWTVYEIQGVYDGIYSDNKITVRQERNRIESYTGYTTPSGKTFTATVIPASGGTSTIRSSGSVTQGRRPVYTSTATGALEIFTVTSGVKTGVTGNQYVASKGTVTSNTTTALTVTGWYATNTGATAETTIYVTQAENKITGATWNSISPSTTTYSKQPVSP